MYKLKVIFCFYVCIIIPFFSFGQNDYIKGIKYKTVSEFDSAVYYFNKVLESDIYNDSLKLLAQVQRGKSFQLLKKYDLALQDFNT